MASGTDRAWETPKLDNGRQLSTTTAKQQAFLMMCISDTFR
jgi:hypothetical protein